MLSLICVASSPIWSSATRRSPEGRHEPGAAPRHRSEDEKLLPVSAVGTREEQAPLEQREEAPVVAFAESDGDDLDAPDVTPEDYLPDDYLVLAGLFGDEDTQW